MLWRQVQARVDASRGEHGKTQKLAREAVTMVEKTDRLSWQGDTLCDLAEVLAAGGRTDEAAEALEEALERYERKRTWPWSRRCGRSWKRCARRCRPSATCGNAVETNNGV